MARENRRVAKRANRPNPREDRNLPNFLSHTGRRGEADDNVVNFDRSQKSRTSRADLDQRPVKRVALIPRNLAQEAYIEALNDAGKSIVFAMGPAGTGKTMLATQFAIQQMQDGLIRKIIITRPAVSVDEQHGFLPGSLIDKLAPWVVPIMDVFKEVYPVKTVEKMLAEEVIEIAPLAYMRGRTMKNAIVIADEMQNATPAQMKMLLTRIGENSRMIVTGDLRQHDRGFEMNGLRDFITRLNAARSQHAAVCQFTTSDVERHPAVEEILRIYGDE